jgi:hypothetical protein
MKKFISNIIAIIMIITTINIPLAAAESNVNYPPEGNKCGYIFSLKETPDFDITNDDIIVISADANVYVSKSIEAIKAIEDKVDINFIAENTPIIPIVDDNLELFSDEISEPNSTDIPETTNIPEIDTPVSTETPETTEEPSSTNEPTTTEEPTTTPLPEHYTNDLLYYQMWHHNAMRDYVYRENDITGKGVKVGVIDTGIMRDWEDFEGVDIQDGINVCALLDNNEERLHIMGDAHPHGTGIIGNIAAKINNEKGIAGIVDECTVIPYKVEDTACSDFANTCAGILKALQLAYEDGCDVVNISMGSDPNLTETQIQMFNTVVDSVTSNGMIIVAAAGNEGEVDKYGDLANANIYPASCENVIGVGAVEPNCDSVKLYEDIASGLYTTLDNPHVFDSRRLVNTYTFDMINDLERNQYKKCDFSTANDSVFISAPGKEIRTYTYGWEGVAPYISHMGTSEATPMVAAAAIGVKQMRPYIDTDMFKEILKETAIDIDGEGYDVNTGYGMIDFEGIYNYVSALPETAPEKTPELTIDYKNEIINGFINDGNYYINDKPITLTSNKNEIGIIFSFSYGQIDVNSDWLGTSLKIQRKARNSSFTDSDVLSLNIPARPEAPNGILTTDTTINGVDNTMEYKATNSDTWTPCTSNKIETSTLGANEFEIRYKATDADFASNSVTVRTKIKEEVPNITVDYKNNQLVGFDSESNYTLNDNEITPVDGKLDIADNWYGRDLTITRKARNDEYVDSNSKSIHLPTLSLAPTGIATADYNIYNVNSDMEYKLTTETEWHEINSEMLENVPFGIYEIRYKATDTAFASEIFTLNVEEKVKPKEITPTAEIEYSRRTLDYLNNTSTYLVNGKEYHTENGSLNIEDSWYGTTITIICKASNEKFQDSEPQEIYIPTLGDAPDFLEVQGTKIKNLKETIEISNKGENNWFTTGATELELEEGEYEIRFMSTTTSFASKSIIVKLEKEPESNYTIETGIKNVDNDIVCTAENNTDGYITATGIIAIYSSSGTLLKIETINGFNAGANDYSISNDFNEPIKVKYFIWTALDNMTAYANTNVSELTID